METHRTLVTGKCPSSSTAKRAIAGFTLLELMVVMAILVLMVSAVPIAINRMMPGRRVAVTAERISTAVRDAQAMSTATGTPVSLEVGRRDITAVQVTRRSAQPVSHKVLTTSSSTELKVNDDDGRPTTAVIVYPDGATSGGSIDIIDGTHQARISISALLGRVSMLRDQ